ncbi:hypothetical protein Taro_011709 [Colocasia esculenta]|uniref:Pentatricopeptide repeat-containing protein-mitochondrial domain-containing protein n=1 Tax=Colocasia esculenta TaxID=4460 RepID=A0A843U243_COLES|nr:hypothetical protein [Colocasia esculenta]
MKNQNVYRARNDVYNMLIRLHARHNRTDQARGLFFEMQEWRCKPDADTYNALINAHGRAGQWRWAMNIMDDMLRAAIPPSRSTYNNVISACGSSGRWKEALEGCKRMTDNGVGPDLVTHNIVLSALKRGSQYLKALSYFELMKRRGISPDTVTLNIVINCLVKLGQYAKAVDVFNSMREKGGECAPDIVTYTSVMHAYSVCGQVENCKAIFDMMLSEGLKPNTISYNALIGAYASHGMHVEAFSVFNTLKNSGFRPDVVSYTSLISAYGRSGKPEKAQEIFCMMKQNSCKPNIVSYNALIDAYGSEGKLAEALNVLREMERDGIQPDVITISTLLGACSRGQIVNIDSILSAAKCRGIELNTIAYNSAIGSYLNMGKDEKALQLYRSMREKKVEPDAATFNILITGSWKLGKYDEALKFLDEMMDLKIPLSKEGRLTEAESMFTDMKENCCCPDVVTYTAMIDLYGAAGNCEKAWDVFQEMEMNDIQPDAIAYSSLMKPFNRGWQPERVLHLAKLMKEKGVPINSAATFEILSSCSMLRDWRSASEFIEKMEPSFGYTSLGLLNQVLHFLGKSGKLDSMMKLFYKIIASELHINCGTYLVLLRHLLAAGKWRKYIEVLQWMEDSGIQTSSQMYQKALPYALKDNSEDLIGLIQGKMGSLKHCNRLSNSM